MELRDSREITYSEYRDLLDLYIKQMIKTDTLQRENDVLHNLVNELRITIEKSKKRQKLTS
jgi:hypothetical protein